VTKRTITHLLHEAIQQLKKAGASTPELDAEVLLAKILATDRTWLIAHPQQPLTPAQTQQFRTLIERRVRHEPLAYITGERWFYDILLHVSPATLIPRPETEELVNLALSWLQAHPQAIVADIGTGSGAIALALAKHAPSPVHIFATDISVAALTVARENARRLQLEQRIIFLQGDILTALPEPVNLIVANLPYVAERDRATLMPEVRDFEPQNALFSGPAGLNHMQRLLSQAPAYLRPGGAMLLEIGFDQADAVRALVRQQFPFAAVRIHQDLAGHDRVLVIET